VPERKISERVWSRRGFLVTSSTAALAAGGAPSGKPARPPALGFDNFSIRAFKWKAPQLIDYAASLKVDVLLLSDLNVYESFEPAYLRKVGQYARSKGIVLQVGTGSICPTSRSYNEKRWGPAVEHARLLIRVAQGVGASVARCYLGTRADRLSDGGIYRHMEAMVKVLKAVRSQAESAGVKLAVENHAGDMQAWELVELIEQAGKEFVGATMDIGNALWTLEDPMVNLEKLAPYVLTTGMRDTAVWETERGAALMWVNMGRGIVDWKRYLERFCELCPRIPFVLEIISYKWKLELPFLEDSFWKAFPRARAWEFARFLALLKRGRPYRLPPGRPTGKPSAALEQAQQKFDLEESLKFCRSLGLGRRS